MEQTDRHLGRWEGQVQWGGAGGQREAVVWKLRHRAWVESQDSEIIGMERVRESAERRARLSAELLGYSVDGRCRKRNQLRQTHGS